MTGQNPGKTAAIILGGIAGVAFLVIFLLFARSLRKKHNGMNYMLQYGLKILHNLFIISKDTPISYISKVFFKGSLNKIHQ
jgi:hypothetical protein